MNEIERISGLMAQHRITNGKRASKIIMGEKQYAKVVAARCGNSFHLFDIASVPTKFNGVRIRIDRINKDRLDFV
jgi:hypothetical protein